MKSGHLVGVLEVAMLMLSLAIPGFATSPPARISLVVVESAAGTQTFTDIQASSVLVVNLSGEVEVTVVLSTAPKTEVKVYTELDSVLVDVKGGSVSGWGDAWTTIVGEGEKLVITVYGTVVVSCRTALLMLVDDVPLIIVRRGLTEREKGQESSLSMKLIDLEQNIRNSEIPEDRRAEYMLRHAQALSLLVQGQASSAQELADRILIDLQKEVEAYREAKARVQEVERSLMRDLASIPEKRRTEAREHIDRAWKLLDEEGDYNMAMAEADAAMSLISVSVMDKVLAVAPMLTPILLLILAIMVTAIIYRRLPRKERQQESTKQEFESPP